MSIIEVKVPKLSESVSEAMLLTWHKKVGDGVSEGENLVDVETDKVVLELPAIKSGVLKKIIKSDNEKVTGGEVIAQIDTAPVPKVASGKISASTTEASQVLPPSASLGSRLEKRVPMTRIRQRIAERLLQSQQNYAILTTFNEVNMQPVLDLRNKHKDAFEKKHGVKLGFSSFFVKAAVLALQKFPIVNASVDGADVLYHGYFDIGVAIGSERGLVVPIIRDADKLSYADIEKQVGDFGVRAKMGKLTMEELSGGTFTISNGGVFGSMLSTPIINPPQSAILGIHAIKERPIAENGHIVIRPMNYLAVSYDHRIIDGREAVQFLAAIKEALEFPGPVLLDL